MINLNFSYPAAEHANKFIRKYRLHHARQTTLAANLKDFFLRIMHGSDPEISYLIGASIVQDWSKPKILPTAVKGLLLHPEKFEFSDLAADLIVDLDHDLNMAFEEIVEEEVVEEDLEVEIMEFED